MHCHPLWYFKMLKMYFKREEKNALLVGIGGIIQLFLDYQEVGVLIQGDRLVGPHWLRRHVLENKT